MEGGITYTTIVVVSVREPFKPDRELHITRAHNVLYLEIGKLGRKIQLLYNSSILPRSQAGCLFTLGACADHLARCKDERSCLGVTNPHDNGSKTLILIYLKNG